MNVSKFIDAAITVYEKEGCKDVKKALKKLTINSDIEDVMRTIFTVQEKDYGKINNRLMHLRLTVDVFNNIIYNINNMNESELSESEKFIKEFVSDKKNKTKLENALRFHDVFKFNNEETHDELAQKLCEELDYPMNICEAIGQHSKKTEAFPYKENPLVDLVKDCDELSKFYPSYINAFLYTCPKETYGNTRLEKGFRLKNKLLRSRCRIGSSSQKFFDDMIGFSLDVLGTHLNNFKYGEHRFAISIIIEALGDKICSLTRNELHEEFRNIHRYIIDSNYHALVLEILKLSGANDEEISKVFVEAQEFSNKVTNTIADDYTMKKAIDSKTLEEIGNAALLMHAFKFCKLENEIIHVYKLLVALGFQPKICQAIKFSNSDSNPNSLCKFFK